MGKNVSYHCDICKIVFKNGDPIYYLAYEKLNHEDRQATENYKNFLKTLNKKSELANIYNSVKAFEMCADCYNTISLAIKKRQDEIQDEWDTITDSYYKKEPEGENDES